MTNSRRTLGLALAVALLGAGCSTASTDEDTARDEQGTIVESGEIGAFRIQVGDCVAGATGDSVETVDGVPCSEPHEAEVFHAFDIDDGDGSFPGTEVVQTEADDGCLAAFEGFVGRDYESSQYVIGSLVPTTESWEAIGDREVVCLISNLDDTLITGSAKGTGL